MSINSPLRNRLNRIYRQHPDRRRLRRSLEKLESKRSPQAWARILEGEWHQRDSGKLLVIDHAFPVDHNHGGTELGQWLGLNPESVRLLAGSGTFDSFRSRQTLFLDTETTGLAGGAGTCAFLIGVGYFRADQFCIRQFFLPDYQSEKALLESLIELVEAGEGFRHLVSFNGKSYDLNLLQNRFVLQRLGWPFKGWDHLDLLYCSRLLWKRSFSDCSLQSLERRLLGIHREGDIPSALIPRCYFRFLRSGNLRSLDRVLEHNRLDLLTLVSLTVHSARLLEYPDRQPDADLFSVVRLYALRRDYRRAAEILEEACQGCHAEDRVEMLTALASLKKRLGEPEPALRLYLEAIDLHARPPVSLLVEAAKLLEHHRRDFRAALALAEMGRQRRALPELEHRCHRLRCRLEGRRWY